MTSPLSATIGAGQGLSQIAERLGLLEKLRRQLVKNPDTALAKLEMALSELAKVFGTLDVTSNDYLNLWLAPENPKQRGEIDKLHKFASGSHEPEMRKAKGDCKKIWAIYQAYLQTWFDRVFPKPSSENEELFMLFRELSDVDSVMVDAIQVTSRWLTRDAGRTLALVEAGKHEEAESHLRESRRRWQPALTIINQNMSKLQDLRSAFIERSGAV